MARAEEYVRSHGLHSIIQETSQNAQAVEDIMRAYRQSGARLEGLFMGVAKTLSDRASPIGTSSSSPIAVRGRLTVQVDADGSFRGILDLTSREDLPVFRAALARLTEPERDPSPPPPQGGQPPAPPERRSGRGPVTLPRLGRTRTHAEVVHRVYTDRPAGTGARELLHRGLRAARASVGDQPAL